MLGTCTQQAAEVPFCLFSTAPSICLCDCTRSRDRVAWHSEPLACSCTISMRVVTLLPSATEIVATLCGDGDSQAIELVGRSHECEWRAHSSALPRPPAAACGPAHTTPRASRAFCPPTHLPHPTACAGDWPAWVSGLPMLTGAKNPFESSAQMDAAVRRAGRFLWVVDRNACYWDLVHSSTQMDAAVHRAEPLLLVV